MASKRQKFEIFIGRFLVVAGVIASVIGVKLVNDSRDHIATIEKLWQKDLKRLADAKKLPGSWNQIKEVKFYGGSETAKKWVSELRAPIQTNPEGTQRLEVLVLSLVLDPNESEGKDSKESDTHAEEKPDAAKPDYSKKYGFILQYNLVDIESENLVWELGRTFYF